MIDVVAKKVSVTVLFEPVEEGWIQARIAEFPAVITAAPTQEEARELLIDALLEYLLSLGRADEAVEVRDRSTSERLEIVLGA